VLRRTGLAPAGRKGRRQRAGQAAERADLSVQESLQDYPGADPPAYNSCSDTTDERWG
jgi:hypothetical protein